MVLEFISKYFPPPKFLKPSHIGVSFSDSNIKAITFDSTVLNSSPKSIVVPLEKGSIVSGKILDPNVVVKALSKVRESLSSPFVCFTIPDELTYIFLSSVPVFSSGSLEESVAFTIEENVPFSLSDTVFDFIPLKIVHKENYEAKTIVAACVKKELENFLDVFKKSGFEPLAAIHESQSISLALTPPNFIGTVCIIHARENRVGIYLSKNRIVCFSTIRLIGEGSYSNQFLDEYNKFLEYCSRYNAEENEVITDTLVCGDFEYAKKIVEALSQLPNGIKPRLGNVWTNVLKIEKNLPSINFENSLSLAGPIGAVLNDII